jgi:hypothetical protein
MGVALEIVIIPLLVVTAIVVATVLTDLHFGAILAGAVFLAILYFVVVKLLKEEHDMDATAPAPEEDEPSPAPPEGPADSEERADTTADGLVAQVPGTEHRSPGP